VGVQILDAENYYHSTRVVQPLNIGSTQNRQDANAKKNPIIREEVQIIDIEKYNHLTRAVQPPIIGSTRKPKKSKCTEKNLVIREEVQTLKAEKYNHSTRSTLT
jgi:hypothetical protein